MKIKITLLFAVLLFGVSFYSCSNDDETPEQETVAEEENQEDSEENADDDSEGDSGDGTDGEEGGENGDTSDEEGADDGSGEGDDTDNGGSDSSGDGDTGDGNGDTGDGNGDSGDGNGDTGDGNGDSGDGNGDSGDGNGDSGDGNGDSGDGNSDSGDNTEEEGSTDDVGPVINVTAPQDGQVFQQGDQVNVDTEITDDSNIAFARLFINGMLLRQENVAPYQWGTNNPNDGMLSSLAPGNYMLNVVAEDEFGNSSESTLSITVEAGSGDEDSGTGDGGNGDGGNGDGGNGDAGNGDGGNGNPTTSCSNPSDAEFLEENGLVVVEFENNSFPGNWDFRTNVSDFQGSGFMVWTGSQSFNDPGNGLVRFKIRIQNPGTYRFIWRSAVTIGDNGTEHNDTWLRFNDADDYFGRKSSNGSIVYPRGTGKTPNPNGSSKDGWFKIYRSGNNLGFKWQSSTSDNDGHNIFVTFNSPGVYTMEVSARSSGHAIDRFVLFDEDDYSPSQATSASNPVSTVNCN